MKINVLVTAVGGRSVGYQILESLRFYKDEYNIITTDAEAFSPGLYESVRGYILPSSKSPEYIFELINIVQKEKIQVILPGVQTEVEAISKNKDILLKHGAIPIVSEYEVVKKCFDKKRLYEFLAEKKILIPSTVYLSKTEDAGNMRFPIIIKPSKDTSGSRNVHIIKDREELQFFWEKCNREQIELLAQEYIGSEDEEYTVGIMISQNKKIMDTIVMKRVLLGLSIEEEREIQGKRYVLSTGYSQGFFVDQPDVKKYCEKVAQIMGVVGPLNIQCRRGVGGVYIFEVHPRFSGSASMRALVGFNEPHYLISNFLKGKEYKKIPHKLGYAVIRKFANTIVKIEQLKKRKPII